MAIRTRTWKTPSGETRKAYQIDYTVNGKRVRETVVGTKKDAEAKLAAITVAKGQGLHTPDSASITVADAAARWLARSAERGLEQSSLASYDERVRLHIVPFIGATKLTQLTAPAIVLWQDALRAAGRSPEAIRKARMALGATLKFAQLRGFVSQNVVASTGREEQTVREEASEPVTVGVDLPTVAEARAIFAATEGRCRAVFAVAAFAGLRASELRGLTWANVDFQAATVTVSQRVDKYGNVGAPKSKAGKRTLPIPGFVVQVLRTHKLASVTNELVFANGRGNPLHRVTMDEEFQAAQVKAGVVNAEGAAKYTGLHCLRHYFASWCINRKVDGGLELPLKVVQVRVGHSSIEMTANVYSHLFPRGDDRGELDAAGDSFLAG